VLAGLGQACTIAIFLALRWNGGEGPENRHRLEEPIHSQSVWLLALPVVRIVKKTIREAERDLAREEIMGR